MPSHQCRQQLLLHNDHHCTRAELLYLSFSLDFCTLRVAVWDISLGIIRPKVLAMVYISTGFEVYRTPTTCYYPIQVKKKASWWTDTGHKKIRDVQLLLDIGVVQKNNYNVRLLNFLLVPLRIFHLLSSAAEYPVESELAPSCLWRRMNKSRLNEIAYSKAWGWSRQA